MPGDARATAENIVWMVGCCELRVLFINPVLARWIPLGYKLKGHRSSLRQPESGDGTM